MTKLLYIVLIITLISCSNSDKSGSTGSNRTLAPPSLTSTTTGPLSSELTGTTTGPISSDTTSIDSVSTSTEEPPTPTLTAISFNPTLDSRWVLACETDGPDQSDRTIRQAVDTSYIEISIDAMVSSRGSSTCGSGYPVLFFTDESELIQAVAFMDGFQYGSDMGSDICPLAIQQFPVPMNYTPWAWHHIKITVDLYTKVQKTWIDGIFLGDVILPYEGSRITMYEIAGGSYLGNNVFLVKNITVMVG